jgi:ribose 5-phosphate isomerase A
MRDLEVLGIPRLRLNSSHPVTTDNGQVIVDLEVEEISDPVSLDGRLAQTPGVLATGLFVGLVHLVLVGEDKEVRIGDDAGSVSHHGSAELGRRPVR